MNLDTQDSRDSTIRELSAQKLISNLYKSPEFIKMSQEIIKTSERYKEKRREFDLKLVYINAGGISLFITLLGVLYRDSQGYHVGIFSWCIVVSAISWFLSMCCLLLGSTLLPYLYEHQMKLHQMVGVVNKIQSGAQTSSSDNKGRADRVEKWMQRLRVSGYVLFILAYASAAVLLIALITLLNSNKSV